MKCKEPRARICIPFSTNDMQLYLVISSGIVNDLLVYTLRGNNLLFL